MIKFYNGINKLKNKISLKRLSHSNHPRIKQTLTKLTITALLVASLTGCGVANKTTSIQNTQTVSPSTITQVSSSTSSSSSIEVSQNNYSLSYNRFLYDTHDTLDNTLSLNEYSNEQGISKSGNNADRRLAKGLYEGTETTVTDEAYNNFINYVDNENVVYVYEDYYNIDEALNKTGATISYQTHSHTDITKDTNLTPDLLVEVILGNNKPYLEEYPEFYELSNEDIKEIATYIVESIESNKENLTDTSLDRVFCQISNLKIVGFDSSDPELNPGGNVVNAQYCTDNTIVIDKKQIALLPNDDAKAKTYKHEINHIYHRVCEDELNEDYELVGISQLWHDLDVNPLFWRWHYEAAAESMVMTEYNTQEAVVYKNFVNYLRSMDLIALINPNYKENALEISSLNNNPEDLFKIFNAETLEEKKELIKLMYSIDYLQIEREDLEEEYQNETGNSFESSLQVKYEMKKSICVTLAKYFYKNLAERIKNDNVTLEDIFYLINVFESDLNTHILYDEAYDESIRKENIYFLEEYITIQDNFFRMLASSNNLDENEIVDLFNSYAMVIQGEDGTYRRNVGLNWLEDTEREFIFNLLTKNITSFTNNIRNMYNVESHQYTR